MNLDSLPMVCLDGTAVRRIREEKKLTQLYVAKVVGVTTDTVSRWENNRYPTIKRENALRLAEALEVSLEEIVQKSEAQDSEKTSSVRRSLPLMIAAFAFLLSAFAIGGYFFFSGDESPPGEVRAVRLLPAFAAPGAVLPVRIRFETEGARGFILREHFPPGWKLIEANPPASSLDNEEGTARWIIKGGESRQLIVYLIRVDAVAPPKVEETFRGDVVANPDGAFPGTVVGDSTIRVAPFLWADLDGNGRIDDSEMLQASDTFEEMKGVHLDWNLLESIWDAGSYLWNGQEKGFQPIRPQP